MTAGAGSAFDLIIRNGTVYDGSGLPPYAADVALAGDQIAAIGTLSDARAAVEIDASGLAVAPGFINMLSHSYMSILQDPRSLGELKQGVTLQIFGEGNSMGPLTPDMHDRMQKAMREGDMPVDVAWRTLAEYLQHAESVGVSQNVASYIGATTPYQAGPGGNLGAFVAWDATTGRRVWEIKEKFPVWSGVVATAGDVVFYGTLDGWFRAANARTGKVLWSF